MITVTVVLPDYDETDKAVAKMRTALMERKGNARAVLAYRFQKLLLQLLEASVLKWANSKKPDIRVIAKDLAFVRSFQQMLKTIPPQRRPRKKKR